MEESETTRYDNERKQQSSTTTTSVHVTALDGLVNVNSLFTIAVFVGLSLATPGQHSLSAADGCDAGISVAKKLLVFEVVSFSFFLSSSLIAQGLKLAINLLNSRDTDDAFKAHINLKVLRFGMLGSALGSVMGCVFLVLSMVNVIQIRLGMLGCGSGSAVHAVVALVVLVSSALLVYVSTADKKDEYGGDCWRFLRWKKRLGTSTHYRSSGVTLKRMRSHSMGFRVEVGKLGLSKQNNYLLQNLRGINTARETMDKHE